MTRLKYILLSLFFDRPDALARRVRIEARLMDAAVGKRALPTADECRDWAIELGTPSKYIHKETK